MPRAPRPDEPDTVLHLTSRGVDGQAVFKDDQDRRSFLLDLIEIKKLCDLRVFAYCLMTNHFHLEVMTGRVPIGRAMNLLVGKHASRFNERHGRVGHLFQSRYGSRECSDESYVLNALAYIHRNPVSAGMVARASDWPWSSARSFGSEDPIVDFSALCELLRAEPEGLLSEHRARLERECEAKEGLQALALQAAREFGLDPEDLARKGRFVTPAKRRFVTLAEAAGFPHNEIAALMNCTRAAIYQLRRGY